MEHQPQADIAGDRPDDRVARRHRQGRAGDGTNHDRRQQSAPQQRQRDAVRQQLMVDVDAGQRDQRPGDEKRAGASQSKAEMPCHPARQARRGQFDERVARGNLRGAIGAAPAQEEPAQHRHILPGCDRRLAAGTGGAGHDQVVAGIGSRRRTLKGAQELRRLQAPVAVEHDRQAVNDDVEKAAHEQTDHEHGADEQQRRLEIHRRKVGQHAPYLQFAAAASAVYTTEPNLKMGRYIAMTMPPTSTPRIAMIIGSSRLDMLSTALSTSAS